MRVLIVGSGGAGKSTLAVKLGQILDLPVIHLDKLYWQPNWVEPHKGKFRQMVAELAQADNWIIDGNYSSTIEVRAAAADTIIFLDFSRWLCLWRWAGRVIKNRGTVRPDMGEGCAEHWDFEMFRWLWTYPRKGRLKMLDALGKLDKTKTIHQFRNPAQVEAFLAKLSCGNPAG